jgi:hypothetical protein
MIFGFDFNRNIKHQSFFKNKTICHIRASFGFGEMDDANPIQSKLEF